MFDIMIKILPNGRVLARNNATGASRTMKATKVSHYVEEVLEAQIKAQEKVDEKIAEIKVEVESQEPEKTSCDHVFAEWSKKDKDHVARRCEKCGYEQMAKV